MGRDLPRCISEPRLSRDKLSHSTSLDSLATPAMPNILREVLYRKLDTKTNILQSKWVKNWAVLQDNTLYIYADSKETDSVIDPLVLYGQQVTPPEGGCKRKYAFQLSGSRCDILLAADSSEKQRQWMNSLGLASIGYQAIPGNVDRKRPGRERAGPIARKDQPPISRRSLSVENISRKLNAVPIRGQINIDANNDFAQIVTAGLDQLDISSGLTRKDSAKQKLTQMSKNPTKNGLLQQNVALSRQLRAKERDLNEINRIVTPTDGTPLDGEQVRDWLHENDWAKPLEDSEDNGSKKSDDESSRRSFYLETDF